MAEYKYRIHLKYLEEGSDPVDIYSGENVQGMVIDYNYFSDARMPMIMVNLRHDKNLLDKMIKHKDTARIQLIVKKINTSTDTKAEESYIDTKCTYDIKDDVFSDKTAKYGSDEPNPSQDPKDVYAETTVSMISEDLIDRNIKANTCMIKGGNMAGLVHNFTSHMPMVIEPFKYNEEVPQLAIKPMESVSQVIEYLNGIKAFYDTPYRLYYDFGATYLLSSMGNAVPVKGEKYSDVIICVRDSDKDEDAFEQGINESKQDKCYKMKIKGEDSNFQINNDQDKDFNKLVGILDPTRAASASTAIQNTMKDASANVNSIIEGIKGAAGDLTQDINNVVVGKNKVDFNTAECVKYSTGFVDNTLLAVEELAKAIPTYEGKYKEQIAKYPTTSSDGKPIPESNRPKDTLTGSVRANSAKVAIKRIRDTTKKKHNDAMNHLKEGQSIFSDMSSYACKTGYGVTSYLSSLQGIKGANLSANIDNLLKTSANNEQDVDKVTELADKAKKEIDSAAKIMEEVCESSYKDLDTIRDYLNALASAADSLKQASIPSSSSSGYVPGFVITIMDQLEEDLTNYVNYRNAMDTNKEQMDPTFDIMKKSCDDGVQMAKDLLKSNKKSSSCVEKLAEMKGKIEEAYKSVSNNISGIASQIQGLANMKDASNGVTGGMTTSIKQVKTANATAGIKDSINAAKAMDSMGIGSIGDLSDISKIGDLSQVSKLGVTSIESPTLNIMNGAGKDRIKFVNLGNDNPNKIKEMQVMAELNSVTLSVTKENVDNSILSLNKSYTVENVEARQDQNGKYLLKHKQEVYIREDEMYKCKVLIDFARAPKGNEQ